MLEIHFLLTDKEYPGTLEISTFYFLAVFVQLILLLPDTDIRISQQIFDFFRENKFCW